MFVVVSPLAYKLLFVLLVGLLVRRIVHKIFNFSLLCIAFAVEEKKKKKKKLRRE